TGILTRVWKIETRCPSLDPCNATMMAAARAVCNARRIAHADRSAPAEPPIVISEDATGSAERSTSSAHRDDLPAISPLCRRIHTRWPNATSRILTAHSRMWRNDSIQGSSFALHCPEPDIRRLCQVPNRQDKRGCMSTTRPDQQADTLRNAIL